MTTKHKIEETKCQKCNEIFVNPAKLKIHLSLKHEKRNNNEIFECLICTNRYTSYATLHKHIESFHISEKLQICSKCDICGVNVYSKSQIDKHMKEHARPYKCFEKNCLKTFGLSLKRRKHYLLYHNNDPEKLKKLEKEESNFLPYKCLVEDCGKGFRTKRSVNKHHQTHKKVRKRSNFRKEYE